MPRIPRNQPKAKASLQDRLKLEAIRLKAGAKALPPGARRDAMMQKARETEIASQVDQWLSSPGLQPPR